ncbi:MAG: GIY-YIG nuclease family protein [bacterium]
MPKQTSLVCQYLENISHEVLKKYQDIIKEYVGRRQGIYALYKKEKLYYVGLASNLRSRLRQHLRDRHGKSWDRFSVYLTIGSSHMKELESLILRIMKPSGNKQKGKFKKSENLKKKLTRDIRSCLNDELTSIVGGVLKVKKERRQIIREETGRTPVLATLKERPSRLRREFKGKIHKARVLKDGRISCKGKIFTSPSLAAAAAAKTRTRNGWKFWLYERAPGDWVRLDELRKKR